ncbi:type VI secretion system ATPase TssH [Geomonas sp. RF6]|uniref:type VI secretion system ATPase TssH n=1 Tax=Geomonas sp. RF6 TaxID=2897342 RepID=UPI001E2D13E1|nr:type VI secretion system ATPase TssH [Geomonas sp. RF6]UFS70712.1 type VI secretion system ATPase TssH [Geomonas sp. RF6]
MAKANLKSLIDKLNEPSRVALEQAAGLCLSQTHYEIDIEHFLLKLLDIPNTDLHKILRHFEINESRFRTDLTRTIDGFKTGNARTPALSPRIPRMIREGWLIASIEHASAAVRSGHILVGLLSDEELARVMAVSSDTFKKISLETLSASLRDLTAGSVEDRAQGGRQGEPEAQGADPAPAAAGTRALDQYTINLTEKAKKGEIDPVLGRDFEVRQMADILIRRRQNNPILTGEAGVGKTAVVEGFALKIVEGDVPPPLRNVEIRTLDLGLLQAGAGIKGEFENRMKSVINEIKSSPIPIILFIDEAHTLIGAGGAAGTSDAANLLKPALARGEMRTIAATTWAEYKKYFEKDPALTRRFQVVKVEEPDEEKAVMMMRAVAPFLEKHHKVLITDDALVDSVRLSHRYIPARQLPDKSVSVLDTACARVAIGMSTVPPALDDLNRRLAQIERETRILARETTIGRVHDERLAALEREKEDAVARLEALQARWQKEKEIAEKIIALQQEIHEAAAADAADPAVSTKRDELKALESELKALQGKDPLVQTEVNGQIISEVISGWTGIPTGRMLLDEIQTVLNMEKLLAERIIGQDHALAAIAQMVQTAHAGIDDPSKPTAVLMFAGPSGVGKTETALALSELLYGGEENLITINMSEYQEAHTVSSLKGSPPGYVGYGEGGVLTEAVRKRPYSVVLLDEVEKAHPDVMELFFQVFDKGTLEDGEGRKIDFKNTLIILTTNLGTDLIMKACADEETRPTWQGLAEMLRPELTKHFKPAFLGRMKVVPYYPISDVIMKQIVKLKVNKIAKRLKENRNVTLGYDESLIDSIAARCTEVDSGARNVDHILTNTLLPEMSKEILSRMAIGEQFKEVNVALEGEGFGFNLI